MVWALPELILAAVFVAAIRLGLMAAAMGLAVGNIDFLGKLVAQSIEEICSGPLEAVRAVGVGWWDSLLNAVTRPALPQLIGHWIYMVDVNHLSKRGTQHDQASGIGYCGHNR